MHPADEVPSQSASAGAPDAPRGRADEIRLSVPAEAPYLRVVSLTAAAIATRHGFAHRTITRLADTAGEAFAAGVAAAADGGSDPESPTPETTVVFRVAGSVMSVQLTVETVDGPDRRDFTVEREP